METEKGLCNCWWSQSNTHIPLAAFGLDLCMSSVYPSQSEHLWTNTHTRDLKCTQTDLPVLQMQTGVQIQSTRFYHSAFMHACTHLHPPPTCTCLAATWEADLTDTSSRSLVAQVLPAAEAVKIFPCSPHNLLPSFFSDRVRSVSRLPVKPVCSLSQGLDFVTAKVRFPRTHPVLFWDTL